MKDERRQDKRQGAKRLSERLNNKNKRIKSEDDVGDAENATSDFAGDLSTSDFNASHRSVLLAETIDFLAPQRFEESSLFVDATLGLGGHSEALLEANRNLNIIGFDRDPQAIRFAQARLARFAYRTRFVHATHEEIKSKLEELGIKRVSGVLADLGVSSMQMDAAERGFSFRFDAPLDMRMNPDGDEATAAQLLAQLPEQEIARIIFEYGEEPASRRIARRIVKRRETGEPVETTFELAELVARTIGFRRAKGRSKSRKKPEIHPATRTFQALRIAVNRELIGLERFIEDAIALLQPAGRLVCISFHSLEDRIVKRTFKRLSGVCECDVRLPICQCGASKQIEILTRRPVEPSVAETQDSTLR